MTLILSGLIIGLVMGLTGAGGALVAIPLFIQFSHMDLKQASVYSLIAVIIATLVNGFSQRKNIQIKLGMLVAFFSFVGSWLAIPLKSKLPDAGIILILALVSIYSLFSVWSENNDKIRSSQKFNLAWPTIPVGLILGTLTTLTGLGGGVLMLPIFLKIFKLNQDKAVATSLMCVGLSALFSFGFQVMSLLVAPDYLTLFYLALGIAVTLPIVKRVVDYLTASQLSLVRQVLFTFVVVLALGKLILF